MNYVSISANNERKFVGAAQITTIEMLGLGQMVTIKAKNLEVFFRTQEKTETQANIGLSMNGTTNYVVGLIKQTDDALYIKAGNLDITIPNEVLQ